MSTALALLEALDARLDAYAALAAAATCTRTEASRAATTTSDNDHGGIPNAFADSWTQTASAPPVLRTPALESGGDGAARQAVAPSFMSGTEMKGTGMNDGAVTMRGADRAALEEMRRLHAASQLLLERPPWRVVSGPPPRSEVGLPSVGIVLPTRGRLRRVARGRAAVREPR